MNDFVKARQAMVYSQLEPNGISAPAVQAAFESTPREKFLPEHMGAQAYCDEDILFREDGHDTLLAEPIVSARQIVAAMPQESDLALVIGDGCGYLCALLAPMVSTVLSLVTAAQADGEAIKRAQKNWQDMNLCNIALLQGKATAGDTEHGPYDLIVINGAVAADVPENLLEQLTVGGRLVAVIKKTPEEIGQITILKKITAGHIVRHALYEAAIPYLPDFAPVERFAFA